MRSVDSTNSFVNLNKLELSSSKIEELNNGARICKKCITSSYLSAQSTV